MTHWFHCNKCYVTPTPNGAKYVLSNCGHIYCNNCLPPGKQNYCCICRSECTTIPCSSNLSPDVQIFFSNQEETLNKFLKVVEFQNNNSARLIHHLKKEVEMLTNKYAHAKQYITQYNQKYEALRKEHERLRNLFKNSIGSPVPGRPGGLNVTPVNAPPPSINSNSSNRRGQRNGWIPNGMMNRSIANVSNQSSAQFRRPTSIFAQTPSMVSVTSESSQVTPNNFSRLNFGAPNRSSGAGYTRAH